MRNRIIALVLLGLATIVLWILARPEPRTNQTPVPAAPGISSPSPALTPPPAATPPQPSTATPAPTADASPPPATRSTATKRNFADPLAPSTVPGVTPPPGSDSDAETSIDFDKITLMLRDYRTLTGENPVGTNAEIMKSIMGGNPKGAMLGPPEGQSVNEAGELIDRWGTPYFFHQLTGDLMEIRSAGEDHRMWTGDDLVR